MSDPKHPFHEVIATKLIFAPIGITGDLKETKIAELAMLLAILQESKMPVAAAHKIAEEQASLPLLLKQAGLHGVAQLATEVLADLRDRKDETVNEHYSTPSAESRRAATAAHGNGPNG